MTLAVHSPDDGAWFVTPDGKLPRSRAKAQRFALVDADVVERRDHCLAVAAAAFDALTSIESVLAEIEDRAARPHDPDRPEDLPPTLDELFGLLGPLRADVARLHGRRADAGF
ncbi:hypothetical protein ACK8HX_02125 [Oryzobacter sp. R7]|uniref:hypothetical protein n=1 Tax=Oryzobacter faecalis TaxID=3388656 RepID=UPI00398CDF8E